MSGAIKYIGLVGKYIRMERPATPEELDLGDSKTVGMECTVAVVMDRPNGCVEVLADYGMGFTITPADEFSWQFIIWPDEETRDKWRSLS